jgi:hypothetical protein
MSHDRLSFIAVAGARFPTGKSTHRIQTSQSITASANQTLKSVPAQEGGKPGRLSKEKHATRKRGMRD